MAPLGHVDGAPAPAARAGGAGLVQSKTSFQPGDKIPVSLSKPECTLRRIKRLKRHVSASSRIMGLEDAGFRSAVPYFVTLTYAEGSEWGPRHVSQALQAFRHWHRKRGLGEAVRCIWVAELTKRKRVHYHLVVWLPHGVKMPQWDRDQSNRSRFWSHGLTETAPLRTNVGYLMKYISKMGEFHLFPKGLRSYGISGLTPVARCVRRWYGMPEWVKRSYGVGDVQRVNNRLVDVTTGEILPPMFHARINEGELILTLLRPYPDRFHDGPFSTFPRGYL